MMHEVVPLRLAHIREICRTMRDEDRSEIEGMGLSVRHKLHQLQRESLWSRAWLIDGRVAAIGGIEGNLLADVAMPWLFTSALVEETPFMFFRIMREQFREMLKTKRVLVTFVAASYERSIRTFSLLGFKLGAAVPAGPGGMAFRQMILERD